MSKQNAKVNIGAPDGAVMDTPRAEVEARRGIHRDPSGKIIRSKSWIDDRIKHLTERKRVLAIREKNCDKKIAKLQEMRKGAK